MKILIAIAVLVTVAAASPLVQRHQPQILTDDNRVVNALEDGPILNRKVRQFGFGGYGGGYDNTNFDIYSQGGNFGGLGGFGGYQNQGFDYSQQQGGGYGGFGGGLGGFGGGGIGGFGGW